MFWAIGLLLNLNAPNPNSEKLKIEVNGKAFNPDSATLSENDVIGFKIVNSESNSLYAFKKIRLEWLVIKKVGNNKKYKQKQSQRARRQRRSILRPNRQKYVEYELDSYQNKGYKTFSSSGKVTIPYKQFKDKYLTRVIIHIDEIEKKTGNKVEILRPHDLGIKAEFIRDGIKFRPSRNMISLL